MLSAPGQTNNDVHNDACLFGDDYRNWGDSYNNGNKVNGVATFQSVGVGYFSACPDPDGAGPRTAVLSDTNGDGRMDRCTQSGYQQKGIAGDKEFHARMNNTNMPGYQSVTFCYDPERNGCADAKYQDGIFINWIP